MKGILGLGMPMVVDYVTVSVALSVLARCADIIFVRGGNA